MLNVIGSTPRNCDGCTRRSFLSVGALGGLQGLSLPDILRAATQSGASKKSMILIWMGGAPSQIDSWDPKPSDGAETPVDEVEAQSAESSIGSMDELLKYLEELTATAKSARQRVTGLPGEALDLAHKELEDLKPRVQQLARKEDVQKFLQANLDREREECFSKLEEAVVLLCKGGAFEAAELDLDLGLADGLNRDFRELDQNHETRNGR